MSIPKKRTTPKYFFHVTLLVLCFSGVRAIAHETWVRPRKLDAKPNETILFDLTSGTQFPENDSPIKPERVQSARLRVQGTWSDELKTQLNDNSLVLEATPRQNGIATLVVDLKPKDIELSDDVVSEYFEEINASEEIQKRWNMDKGKFPWKEVYSKNAKTLFAVGDIEQDDSWKRSAGTAFELVPITNPFRFSSNETFEMQLLANGKPIPDFPIGLITQDSPKRVFETTDANGVAKFKIKSPTNVLFYSVKLNHQGEGKWTSNFATVTFLLQ